MKRVAVVLFLLAGVVAYGWTGNACAQQKPIELSLNLVIPQTHQRYVSAIKPWTEDLEKRTQGRLKITPYFANTMTPGAENYESAVTGLADMAEAFIGFTPGRFPVAELAWLPDININSKYPTYALWDVYKRLPEARKEWADTQVLALHACLSYRVLTGKKAVRTLEDAKGLKLVTTTKIAADTAKEIGATPVTVGLGDVYSAAEKGVVDGSLLPTDLLQSRKFAEVFHYGTRASMGYDAFFMVMNKKKYGSLPADIRKIIDEMSGDYLVDLYAKAWVKIIDEGAKYAVEKEKFQFIDLSPAELARWEKVTRPIWDRKAAELEGKGLPGKKLIVEWRGLLEKFGK
jgi:TRAP-type transport system periplasmic protein